MAVLVRRRRPDYGSYGVVVSQGIFHPLEDNDTDTLSSAVSVGALVESEASPIGTQDVEPGHRHHGIWREDEPRASSNSLVAVLLATRNIGERGSWQEQRTIEDSPVARLLQASWTDTMLALQPVSMTWLVPARSKACETRFARIAMPFPVAAYGGVLLGSRMQTCS